MTDERLEYTGPPIPPKPGTLESRALAALRQGPLTSPEFQVLTGSWRLAATVRELRLKAWPIDTVRVQSGRVDGLGRPCYVGLYTLTAGDGQGHFTTEGAA